MSNEWNINDIEGEEILKKLLIKSINIEGVCIDKLPILLKKEAKNLDIKIKKKDKNRNINNYIKIKYGSINNLLVKFNHIFYRKGNLLILSKNYEKESKEYEFV